MFKKNYTSKFKHFLQTLGTFRTDPLTLESHSHSRINAIILKKTKLVVRDRRFLIKYKNTPLNASLFAIFLNRVITVGVT